MTDLKTSYAKSYSLFSGVFWLLFALAATAGRAPAEDATTAAASAPSPDLAPFPPDARWAAIGDSITHAGWYIHFIHFYYLTRFPKQDLTLFDSGCNGEAAWQCIKRYPYDIAPLHPSVVSIMFGMNDGGLAFYNPNPTNSWAEPVAVLRQRAIDSYEKNLKALVQQFLQDKISVIVITPTPYDETVKATNPSFLGYNETLTQLAARAKKVAQEEGVPVIDFNGPMNKINQQLQATDPTASIVGSFRVHPGPAGHLVMAYLFLKAQHAPSEVARFSIKGTDGTVASSSNCSIDQVKVGNGTVSFRYSANSLPFPVEHWYRTALTWVPFTTDLNQEIFQVTDLAAGNYDVQIDGKTVVTATAQEMAAGINLSENDKTPQYQQAARAWHVYQQQFDSYVKLRDLVCDERTLIDASVPRPLTLDQINPILDGVVKAHAGKPDEAKITKECNDLRTLKAKEADFHAQIDAALKQVHDLVQPQPHLVTVTPSASAAPAGP